MKTSSTGFVVAAIVLGVTVAGCRDSAASKIDLKAAEVNGPSAAELAPIFKIGSDHTDLQRDAREKEIKGKIVSWKGLVMYEARKNGEKCYRLQTSANEDAPGTFIKTCPEDDAVAKMIEALKTGDRIDVKGRISDITMRNIDVDPAIVSAHSGSAAGSAPTPKAAATGDGKGNDESPGSGDDTKPAGGPPSAAGTSMLTVSKVTPKIESDYKDKSKKFLRVEFKVTTKTKVPKGVQLAMKASCRVGGEKLSEKSPIFGVRLDEMDAGETKTGSDSVWLTRPLEGSPSSCTIQFGTERGFSDAKFDLGDHCFVPPSTVTDGKCPN